MGDAARLQGLLGLTDDELLRVLDADPLTLLSGELDHLLARDFGAFEDALSTLAERGFVLRS